MLDNIEQKENQSVTKPLPFDPRNLIDETGRFLKPTYTLAETAFMMSCDAKTVRRYLERGLLQRSKAQRHIIITAESIRTFLKTTV